MKAEVKRGKGEGRGQGLKGKEGGRMREKGWEERGPKAHSQNSDFGTAVISVLWWPFIDERQLRHDGVRE